MKPWPHLSQLPILLLCPVVSLLIIASAPASSQAESQAAQYDQAGDYSRAIQLWTEALQPNLPWEQQATLLENLARAHQQIGKLDLALTHWERLISLYQTQRNQSQIGRIWVEKAQVLSRQGKAQEAIVLLCNHEDTGKCGEGSALGLARKYKDLGVEVAALGSLGEAYRLQGAYDRAIHVLTLAKTLATQHQPLALAAVNNSLGNVYSNIALTKYRKGSAFEIQDPNRSKTLKAEGQTSDRQALDAYQASVKAAEIKGDRWGKFNASINQIALYKRLGQTQEMDQTWQESMQLMYQLPPSRRLAYGAIELANLLNKSPETSSPQKSCMLPQQQEALLQKSLAISQQLGDQRAGSFALGALGNLAECQGELEKAISYSKQAIVAADQSLGDRDSLALWEWQQGRILRATGETKRAIEAYQRAITALEQVRADMANAKREVQFDFRDTINPIYRELMEMQLSLTEPSALPSDAPNNLKNTLTTLDSLKLAELQNYFGNDCVLSFVRERLDQRPQANTAVLTTIVGEKKTAVILSLPNGGSRFHWIEADRSQIEKTANAYRLGLESYDQAEIGYDPKLAQQIYNWLIAPFEQDLKEADIKTLVFVQDGMLRTVPMAALHDGQRFLVQKYAIATSPSLRTIDVTSRPPAERSILAMGYTQAIKIRGASYQALRQVKPELDAIQKQASPRQRFKQLLDNQFTRQGLEQALKQDSYSILHVATHGKFGVDAEDTFFITGDQDNPEFSLNDLDKLIRRVSKNTNPLDLLFLTACETAIGDDRSALGLAGVAVQGGASSAVATLWSVNDSVSARLAIGFYGHLGQGQIGKAQALRSAQLDLLNQGGAISHPYYWSGFLLVGNWL
jgi:CHAT domain-containing protein